MPAASHFIYALSLVIPLIILFPKDEAGKSKINRMALAIYIINNYVGPDSYWVYSFIPIYGHSYLGYVVWSIPLSLFYSYLSRFRLEKNLENMSYTNREVKKGNFASKLKLGSFRLVDTEKYSVDWKNAYFLTLAGGFSHFFIDMIGHMSEPIFLAPNLTSNLSIIQSWGYSYYHQMGAVSIIGYLILFSFSLLLLYYIQQDVKEMAKFFIGFVLAVYLAIWIFGGEVFGELEYSTSFLIFLFFTIPNSLLFYALSDLSKRENEVKEIDENKTLEIDENKNSKESGVKEHRENNNQTNGLKKLIYTGLFLLAISITLCAVSIFAMFNSDYLGVIFDFDADMIAQAAVLALIISIVLIILTILMLALKSNFARKTLVILMGMLFALIIPVAIALMLSENEVIKIFENKE